MVNDCARESVESAMGRRQSGRIVEIVYNECALVQSAEWLRRLTRERSVILTLVHRGDCSLELEFPGWQTTRGANHPGSVGILVFPGHHIGPHGVAHAVALELGPEAGTPSQIREGSVHRLQRSRLFRRS